MVEATLGVYGKGLGFRVWVLGRTKEDCKCSCPVKRKKPKEDIASPFMVYYTIPYNHLSLAM